jgi:hypothetical protein
MCNLLWQIFKYIASGLGKTDRLITTAHDKSIRFND